MIGTNLWRCKACDVVLHEDTFLRAKSPFDDSTLTACPRCLQHDEGFTQVCDECQRDATCGWPTKDGGYRRTCGEHMQ